MADPLDDATTGPEGDETYTFAEHARQVSVTRNRELNFKNGLLNAALGIGGEAGEILEHIKKVLYHGLPLDSAHVMKEIGDLFWYCFDMCETLDISPAYAAKVNIIKLRERFGDEGFTQEKAIARFGVKPEDVEWLAKELEDLNLNDNDRPNGEE